MGRLLAIDLGFSRIGLALSDPMKIIASPFKSIKYTSENEVLKEIAILCKEKEVEKVIIGYPFNDEEKVNPIARMAERFITKLSAFGINVLLWDESFTSRLAEDYIRKSGRRRKSMRDKIDGIAAALILKNYMENRV